MTSPCEIKNVKNVNIVSISTNKEALGTKLPNISNALKHYQIFVLLFEYYHNIVIVYNAG